MLELLKYLAIDVFFAAIASYVAAVLCGYTAK